MKTQFISLKRLQLLENSVEFISSYRHSPEFKKVEHVVGASTKPEDRDDKATTLLQELGQLNLRREEIIKQLMEKV